ncbi:hypothetical protein SBA1_460001 [Candidatus Sulfotelmatobacter kueseliae]|uniref:Uncharacterized protein n=1 Tax=Candidatus Sulfotelmatobacter kueseliae TaxID=2042962 RepID=A0A2U3KRY6_9BACT|nr:hypothetical protein SBA1_460001 [Candidatus Sulfotelmatobacter kueseliae]
MCVRTRTWVRRWSRRYQILAPQGRNLIARHGSAGKKWDNGESPEGTALVLTHTLKPRRERRELYA